MKTNLVGWSSIAFLAFSICICANGQGTFIYDQQSATETTGGGSAVTIQSNQPIGQSFTPSFPFVGFIRLDLFDGSPSNNLGATLYVNLRSGSITGTVLGSSGSVSLPDGLGRFGTPAYIDFYFFNPISVSPGTPYYFQPVVQSGDTWGLVSYHYNYPGGTAYSQGNPFLSDDLWFREGVVPEPSSIALLSLGIGVFACLSQFRKPANASTKF